MLENMGKFQEGNFVTSYSITCYWAGCFSKCWALSPWILGFDFWVGLKKLIKTELPKTKPNYLVFKPNYQKTIWFGFGL